MVLIGAGILPCTVSARQAADSNRDIVATLQPFVDRGELAGAVTAVADKDKMLALDSVGFADVSARKQLKPDAIFWIASQSKPITTSALMILVDEGKVRLDDPVERFLPEFKDLWVVTERDPEHVLLKRPGHPITVREILSHTSGMPFTSALEQPTLDTLPLRVAVGSYRMTPLQFEPGTKYQYSNAGINTAGRIIEVVSEIPYEEFLNKRLLEPLGMKDTTFWPTEAQLARLAKSYRPNADKNGLEEITVTQLKYPLNDRTTRYPMPAGGLFSTAHDLVCFCQMIMAGGVFEGKRYLSEESVKQMTSRHSTERVKPNYGLGWDSDGSTFGHAGAYATDMRIDPKRGLITIFLVQHAGFPGKGDQSRGAFIDAARKRWEER
jgi:CubicO group peptidase (beta-lactamase class C family)